MTHQPNNVFAGTQVVSLVEVRGANNSLVHPRGAVGVVTRTPAGEAEKHFLVRFPDGFEASLTRDQLDVLIRTFNGYALSQFKKIEQDIRNHGEVRWKHAMHLLRLLITGAAALREGRVPVRVEAHRDRLLAVKTGAVPWPEVDAWRRELHNDFECTLTETKLPERPDYEMANRFLVNARRRAVKSI
jgi:hypothetical protein